jgi:hypothetical protein
MLTSVKPWVKGKTNEEDKKPKEWGVFPQLNFVTLIYSAYSRHEQTFSSSGSKLNSNIVLQAL